MGVRIPPSAPIKSISYTDEPEGVGTSGLCDVGTFDGTAFPPKCGLRGFGRSVHPHLPRSWACSHRALTTASPTPAINTQCTCAHELRLRVGLGLGHARRRPTVGGNPRGCERDRRSGGTPTVRRNHADVRGNGTRCPGEERPPVGGSGRRPSHGDIATCHGLDFLSIDLRRILRQRRRV